MMPGPETTKIRTALLIDWGGVLTSNLFASFHAYCLQAEIDPQALSGRFKADPQFRELLIALEKGELDEPAFETRFAALLEVEPGWADRRTVRGRGTGHGDGRGCAQGARGRDQDGARVELVGRAPLPARAVRGAVRRRGDLRRGGHAQALATDVRAGGRARRGATRRRACTWTICRSTSRPPQELGMATVHHTSAETTIPELERLLGISLYEPATQRANGDVLSSYAAKSRGHTDARGLAGYVPDVTQIFNEVAGRPTAGKLCKRRSDGPAPAQRARLHSD